MNVLAKESEKLKNIVNEQSTVEELIKHNKNLRIQLQNFVERPIADNEDIFDSVSVLQKALVTTEEIINKRKSVLPDQEMKEKLIAEGRCTVCTLKLPCKHQIKYDQTDSSTAPPSSLKKQRSNNIPELQTSISKARYKN